MRNDVGYASDETEGLSGYQNFDPNCEIIDENCGIQSSTVEDDFADRELTISGIPLTNIR